MHYSTRQPAHPGMTREAAGGSIREIGGGVFPSQPLAAARSTCFDAATFQRRLDRAATYLETSHQELPGYPLTHWVLAACYAQMGRPDEARAFAKSHGIQPEGPWLKMKALYHDPARCEFLFAGLRLATGEKDAEAASASTEDRLVRRSMSAFGAIAEVSFYYCHFRLLPNADHAASIDTIDCPL